ncbi:hypothetical protein LIER_33680 [Lithospermum erythrorhizon]|uniref:J domain-containing protein n=1 Tax=Lithospermum erythrorhizon TaxID=34254 RepID=A0AAV3S1C5_LITER
MDGNKDEALKCIGIAKEAISSGNRERALKFINIARRLNENISVDELLAECENLGSGSLGSSPKENVVNSVKNEAGRGKVEGMSNGERSYTQEHMTLIREIKSKRDYYSILGLEKGCSVEEIRKAYRKLSLKVHPDKNKAPGAEDAFKQVSMAFKCLSDESSRRQYDQGGLVDEFEHEQQYNVRRRRRRTEHEFYGDQFDADEIFRAFFGQPDMFRRAQVHRERGAGAHNREDVGANRPNMLLLLQLLPFLLIIVLAYLPFSEPEYSLQKNYSYQFRRMTDKHGVEFFVKSPEFDQKYPIGTPARNNIENNVIKDYKSLLGRYCHVELQRRQWSRNLPTPHCDKLQNFGLASA